MDDCYYKELAEVRLERAEELLCEARQVADAEYIVDKVKQYLKRK